MIINRTTLALPATQYRAKETAKTGIVLHHTVGSSAKSTVDYWKSTNERVATAYIIERDGTVYECFDPRFWAYHIGTGSNDADNKRFIGIELASAGALNQKQPGKFYDTFNNLVKPKDVYENGTTYRGFRYFAAYTEAQIAAQIELIEYLLKLFPTIPRQTPQDHTGYLPSWKTFEGIGSHTHFRVDKTDVHPGYDWNRLVRHCNLQKA
jgi:N-acetyl-anhydromuramyl-L-alanine amidase AmpD